VEHAAGALVHRFLIEPRRKRLGLCRGPPVLPGQDGRQRLLVLVQQQQAVPETGDAEGIGLARFGEHGLGRPHQLVGVELGRAVARGPRGVLP